MKKIFIILISVLAVACNNDDDSSIYTGNEKTYKLNSASEFPVEGSVTFREVSSGDLEVIIELTGTEGDIEHPTHLHRGDVSIADAEMAALLTPVSGETGLSVTLLNNLVDETPFTYEDLLQFEGHIKVHLDGGANKSVILAKGNVGALVN